MPRLLKIRVIVAACTVDDVLTGGADDAGDAAASAVAGIVPAAVVAATCPVSS